MSKAEAVLELKQIFQSYPEGKGKLEILNGADLTIKSHETVALIAPSGTGKSTLLHVAGLLEHPDEGEIIINGKAVEKLNDKERTQIRRENIGFIYQFHHLLPEFSALENVCLPQLILGHTKEQSVERAMELLDIMGLSERISHRPSELSGGEQQRVAIARAMANEPSLLLADEPTGNLDPQTADKVFQALMSLTRQQNCAALIATHNMELAARFDRRITLQNGSLVEI